MKTKLFLFIFCITFGLNAQVLDISFDTDGIRTDELSQINSNDIVLNSTIQNDGKIIVVGRNTSNITQSFIARINPDNTFDTTFSSDGYIFLSNSLIDCVVVQNDGKIIIAGQNAIYRYNSNGTLDNTFAINPINPSTNNLNFRAKSLKIQSDNKILIAGYYSNSTISDIGIIRFNSDGTYDNSFDSDGISILDFNTFDECFEMELQNDGKILLIGQTKSSTYYDLLAVRLNVNGSFDTTFDSDGKVITTFGANTYSRDIELQQDGKILIFSSSKIIRLNTNGIFDNTFDSDGIVNLPLTVTYNSSSSFSALHTYKPKIISKSDGKILLSFSSGNTSKLIQLYNYGAIDSSFGNSGTASSVNTNEISTFLFLYNNKILTGGNYVNPSDGNYDINKLVFDSNGNFENYYRFNTINYNDSYTNILDLSNGSNHKLTTLSNSEKLTFFDINNGSILSPSIDLSIFANYNKLITNENSNILISGFNSAPIIKKYNFNGQIDTNFGLNGEIDLSNNFSTPVATITNIKHNTVDNKIYVAFEYFENITNPSNNNYSSGLCRIDSAGNLDTTYGINGYVKVRFDDYGTSSDEYSDRIVQLSNGQILLISCLNNLSFTERKIAISKFNINGILDTSYGTNGKTVINSQIYSHITDFVLLPDNSIIINNSYKLNNTYYSELIKVNNIGIIENSYGNNGFLNDIFNLKEIILLNNGQIIKAGQKDKKITTCRINSNGTLDTTYGTNGYLTTTVLDESNATDILKTIDNKIIVCGNSYSYSQRKFYPTLVKYIDLTLGNLEFEKNNSNLLVYPNPIDNETSFEYELTSNESITISLFDVQGKEVKSILKNQNQNSGKHSLKLYLSELKSGNYFLKFSTSNGSQSLQLIKK